MYQIKVLDKSSGRPVNSYPAKVPGIPDNEITARAQLHQAARRFSLSFNDVVLYCDGVEIDRY